MILSAICFFIIIIYAFLSTHDKNTLMSMKSVNFQPVRNQKPPYAYIITSDCKSERFNGTKANIERAFPNFFNIVCYPAIPFNDSRIHTENVSLWKKYSSNLLAFVDIWTYKIPNQPNTNKYEWAFIFEDDVNFNKPSKVSLRNYIKALEEIMYYPEIQSEQGFLYLGICGPKYNDTRPFISKNTNNRLLSRRGYGFCLHATGITKHRARLFWAEISSHRPSPNDASLDLHIRSYCIRSNTYFYTLGSNLHYPPGTGHFGIAYQDRGRFPTTVA